MTKENQTENFAPGERTSSAATTPAQSPPKHFSAIL
jgi:hypothetical protein